MKYLILFFITCSAYADGYTGIVTPRIGEDQYSVYMRQMIEIQQQQLELQQQQQRERPRPQGGMTGAQMYQEMIMGM